MKVIRFLRSFRATRVIKGRFRLASVDGGRNQGYAYNTRDNQFEAGQKIMVHSIKQGSVLVVADNPILGEVVLDGAEEGVDFEVVPIHDKMLEPA